MLHFTDYIDFRNGNHYQTSDECILSDHGCTEEIANRISSQNVEGENPEFRTLTPEALNEQIKESIGLLTRRLEELIRLVQVTNTSRLPNSHLRTELGTSSGTAMPQCDI